MPRDMIAADTVTLLPNSFDFLLRLIEAHSPLYLVAYKHVAH